MHTVLENLLIEVDTEIGNEEIYVYYAPMKRIVNIPYSHNAEKEYTSKDKAEMLLAVMNDISNFPEYKEDSLQSFTAYMHGREVLDDLEVWYEQYKQDFETYKRLLYLLGNVETFKTVFDVLNSNY